MRQTQSRLETDQQLQQQASLLQISNDAHIDNVWADIIIISQNVAYVLLEVGHLVVGDAFMVPQHS